MKTLFSAAARCLSKPRLPSRCSHHKMLSALASSQRSRSSLDVQLEKFYTQSLEADDFFDVKKIVSMEECFDARMHLGHKRDCWHDGFQEYIYGNRLDVDIIDLEKTVERLKVALNAVAHVAFRNGIFLFTLRSGHRECHFVDQLAVQVGEYSNTRRWSETFLSARAAMTLSSPLTRLSRKPTTSLSQLWASSTPIAIHDSLATQCLGMMTHPAV